MKKRYLFLDMLRALAVAEMIHGHSLEGLLDTALRSTPFFVNWTHVRGYTAPVFLFAAGFAFALATLPRVDEYSKFSKTLLTRLRRLFFVVLLGYLMYLPYFSLRQTILSIGTSGWDNLLRVDILRCIGVSALFLQLWFLLKPKRIATWIVVGAITIALPILTPVVRQSDFVLNLPAFIRYYFVDSRFPLFYYASFLFLGFMLGSLFTNRQGSWLKYSVIAAVLLILFGQVLNWSGALYALRGFITRGGVIILLTVLLERGERLWERMPRAVKYFGKESLVVYVVHLMIIYGSVLNRGLVSYWGRTLSYSEVYLFVVWLFAAMVILAYFWHKLKLEHMPVAHWVKNTIYWSFLALFLLKPH
ncbi:MAG: heparan-alpha-glucosaminide N-acetyltransferase domain-containing protein [candidate division WOR-3 bacterium]|nr:heparan-alpha-glucosaminide N-acetyltransferase domain-containing protein [candidate division WOR-3 bacterium]